MTRKKSQRLADATEIAAAPRRPALAGRPGRQIVGDDGAARDEIEGDIAAADRRPARAGRPGRKMLPGDTPPTPNQGD